MSLSLPGGALGESGVDHTHTVCHYMLFYITVIWLTGLLHGVDVKGPKLPQSKGRESENIGRSYFWCKFLRNSFRIFLQELEHLKALAINLA